MPLAHYGVLVGTLRGHARDQPDTQGRWYHVNLDVEAPLGHYRCAVDVDSKQSATGVEWKTLVVPAGAVSLVGALPAGYHELQRLESAGAVDLLRHPAFVDRPGCLSVRRTGGQSWTSGSNLEAATALEATLAVGRRTLVWGEPFNSGLGMHNIHQNQGDPAGSQWWAENGIWQDGATLTARPDGAYDAFVSKFSTQADRTDAAGHPA